MNKQCITAIALSALLLFTGCGSNKTANQTSSSKNTQTSQENIQNDMKKLTYIAQRNRLTEAEVKDLVKELKKLGVNFDLIVPPPDPTAVVADDLIYVAFSKDDYKYPTYDVLEIYKFKRSASSKYEREKFGKLFEKAHNIGLELRLGITRNKDGKAKLSSVKYKSGIAYYGGDKYLYEDGKVLLPINKLFLSQKEADKYINDVKDRFEKEYGKSNDIINFKVRDEAVVRPVVKGTEKGKSVYKHVLVGVSYDRKLYAGNEHEYQEFECVYDDKDKFLGIKNNNTVLQGHDLDYYFEPNLENNKQANNAQANGNIPAINMSSISETTQTSADKEGDYVHSANLTIDGNIASCWTEGVDGLGIGESLSYNFNGTYKVSGIDIWIGHQKSTELFYQNARPTAIKVQGSDGYSKTFNLKDEKDVQRIQFEKTINVNSITLTVQDAHPGSKYADTCIAEVKFF